ncbi:MULTISPECIES: cupin domain-containing protein [unclassified Sphingomonas]|uniref:cupin domain-containing protein n=1 Tax=unclassified Sphingomonas TaxID=196159 RepID=UPI000A738F72|nr:MULTISPECIES: cupin domain-containing protein [unclassified Sphingomonas]
MMLAAFALLLAGQAADPTGFASNATITAEVEAMGKAMKPDQGFAWKPLVRDGDRVASLEYWKAPGRPAVHPDQAEYAIVIAGAGTLRSGGTMVGGRQTQPGLIEGDRIVGATERSLKPGDVMLIPAGVPHWFGITGDRLVLLGTKLPAK